jgi:hypothetical protein
MFETILPVRKKISVIILHSRDHKILLQPSHSDRSNWDWFYFRFHQYIFKYIQVVTHCALHFQITVIPQSSSHFTVRNVVSISCVNIISSTHDERSSSSCLLLFCSLAAAGRPVLERLTRYARLRPPVVIVVLALPVLLLPCFFTALRRFCDLLASVSRR